MIARLGFVQWLQSDIPAFLLGYPGICQCSAVSQRLVADIVAGSLLSGVEDALSRGIWWHGGVRESEIINFAPSAQASLAAENTNARHSK